MLMFKHANGTIKPTKVQEALRSAVQSPRPVAGSASGVRSRAWMTFGFPIGKFAFDAPSRPTNGPRGFAQIAEAPALMRAAVNGLSDRQFDTPYRPGGWTVRQVVHHVPDSHLNAYCRYKFALTEDNPTIKAVRRGRVGQRRGYGRGRRRTSRWRCSTRCTSAGWCCSNR